MTKCFKHFNVDAVCSEEVSIGYNADGEIFEIKPICQQCLDDHEKRKRRDKKIFYAICMFVAVFVLILLKTDWLP